MHHDRDTKETIEDKIRRAEAKLGIPAGEGVAINYRRPSFDPGIIVVLGIGILLVRHFNLISAITLIVAITLYVDLFRREASQ